MKLTLRETSVYEGKVDKENHILRGVKLVGLTSPTRKRRYTEDALSKAIALYEGAQINIGHLVKGENRSPRDVLGRTTSVRFESGKGLYGDVQMIPSHDMTPRMEWIAENMPDQLCMSHAAVGYGDVKGGEEVIEEIAYVHSVDVVAKGGTTKSLFESELVEGPLSDRLETRERMDHIWEVNSTAYDMIWEAFYGEGTPGEKKNKIGSILDDWAKELDKVNNMKESEDMKDLTLVKLREGRPEILEEAEKPFKDRITALETENADLKAKVIAFQKVEKVAARSKLIEDAALPATVVTEKFRTRMLAESTSDDEFTVLLEERKELATSLVKPNTPKSTAKDLREQAGRGTAPSTPLDASKFAATVKG